MSFKKTGGTVKMILIAIVIIAFLVLCINIVSGYYFKKGNEYHAKGQYDKAIAAYNKALILNPRASYIYVERGITYGRQMQPVDKSIEDFNKAIKLNSKSYMAYYNLGLAKLIKHDISALGDFNKAIELNPKYSAPYWALGTVYKTNGMKKEAIAAYENFIKYAPSNRASDIEKAQETIKILLQD